MMQCLAFLFSEGTFLDAAGSHLTNVPGLALMMVAFVLIYKVVRARCTCATLGTAEGQASLQRLLRLLRGTAWTTCVVSLLIVGGLMCGFIERADSLNQRIEMAFVLLVLGPSLACIMLGAMVMMLALGTCYVLEFWLAGKRLEAAGTLPGRRKGVVAGLYVFGILVVGGSLWGVTSLFAGPTFSEKFDQAVEAGDVPRVKALLADADWLELDEEDAMARAAHNGHLDLVKLFDPGYDATRRRAIVAATNGGQKHVFRWVVDRMSMRQSADLAPTPLHLAVLLHDPDLVKLTIEKGADANAVLDDWLDDQLNWDLRPVESLDTPLHIGARFTGPACIDICRILLDNGARLNATNIWSQTPLHLAANRSGEGTFEVIRMLVDHGAQVNAVDSVGCTPLHFAARQFDEGAIEVIRLLVDHGAQVNVAEPNGFTPLHYAANLSGEGTLEIIRHLLQHGAQVGAVTSKGNTPLHLVAYHTGERAIEGIRILLDHGARANAVNSEGDTPLDIAMQSGGEQALISLLRERGAKTRDELDKLTTRPSE